MTNEQIRRVFNIPERDLLQFLLNKVNLSDKELKILELCLIKGKTEEQTAEILEMSRNGVQKIKKNAFNKISKVWDNDRIIKILIE